jgi:hypothetical protein
MNPITLIESAAATVTKKAGVRFGLRRQSAATTALFDGRGAGWESSPRFVRPKAVSRFACHRSPKCAQCSGFTLLFALAVAALSLTAAAAPIPGPLLVDQAQLTNDVLTDGGYGNAVAVHGNTAVVGVEGGDPFASVHVFERTGAVWQRVGRLTDSRASVFGGFGHAVAVSGQTIAVGDPFQNNAAFAFVRGGSPGLNAWNITDNNSSGVGPSYIVYLAATQHTALTTNAWRYSVTARMVHDLEGGVCLYFAYGNTTRRWIFFLDFTGNGDLLAQLEGASPAQYLLTTNGVTADDYHLHEIEFNPATGMATYRFDGMPIKTWAGQAITIAEGVRWGAGSTPGRGSINVHKVHFEVTGTGAVLADYNAGAPDAPPASLNPLAQGWSVLNAAGAAGTSQRALTPDIGTIWTEQARLTAVGGGSGAFGSSIDIDGDTMVVGDRSYNDGSGSAYVFVRQGSNWTQQAVLSASPLLGAAEFGQSVAIDGDTIIVGSAGRSSGQPTGRAYIYTRSGTTWTQAPPFAAPGADNVIGNRFGASVDISGDGLVIGAPVVDSEDGAIYVAERSGGVWGALVKLQANPVIRGDNFGAAVAMQGDSIVVSGQYNSISSYLFTRRGPAWSQSLWRQYPIHCEEAVGGVAIDGETIVVGVPSPGCSGEIGERAGVVYVQAPDYANAGAVAGYVNEMLYYPAAPASGETARDLAAFRYKHLLYGQSNGLVRARFENMALLYGEDERVRAREAEELLSRGLSLNPDSALLGNLLLDICYDRTVAETILTKDLAAAVELTRFGPQNPNGFLIDDEIGLYRQIEATNRFALQCYFDLLKKELLVQQTIPPSTRWAARVLGFSSEWVPEDPTWNAIQALGMPDTYPVHDDFTNAWASATDDDQREFLELGYDNPTPINSVSIYETYNPGAVDKVSVRNPNTGQWEQVWSGTAAPAGTTSRIFTVSFPLTSFPVDAIRLDFNSPAVPDWNEIDAVGISDLGSTITMTDSRFGHRVFQTLVPQRGLAPATYTNSSAMNVVVTTNSMALTNGMLYTGYKDLVLLFDLLRDYGRSANTLGRLLAGRNNPGDAGEAKALIGRAQPFLFLQGALLKNMFPVLPPPGDPSGLAEAIAGWEESLNGFETLQAVLAGDVNLLGFAPDFLMLIENFQDPLNPRFDSFDSFEAEMSSATSPLSRAKEQLQAARDNYGLYRGYEDQIEEQFDQSADSYGSRLFEIVGARPGQSNYSDSPTNNPGSELDQQFRSIEIARLRILKNSLEISNLTQQVSIEVARAGAVADTVIKYGDQQASLTRTIGHINATQAAMDGLASTFSPEKLLKGAVIFGLLNTVVQAGGEEAKGQLEARKEELAASERAEVEGIESDARVKTLLLGMSTLAVDSLEAGQLLQQEVARLAGLYREKADLEARIAERSASIASRYFADPIHRVTAESGQITASLGFADAQRWLFFMARALEYKWNTPFANFQHPPGGRVWSDASLFKLRNADELDAFFDAMLAFDGLINRGKTYRFDWFSVREDFMGLKQTNELGQLAMYTDPQTGRSLDAISLFRTNLLRTLRAVQGGQEIVLEFNTVRQIPGGFFFVGPTFDLNGNVINKGRFLDKIDYLQIRLPGSHSLGRPQLAGNLTYGGTSFIRNFNVGHFDPLRPDRLIDELTAYSTRYWFYDPTASQMRWRFNEGLTIDSVEMQLTADPRIPPTVTQIEEFKERSVAATGWKLTIPLVQQNVQVMRINELNDVEIYLHHYSAQRQ